MFKKIREWLFPESSINDLQKAKRHAILALAYWCDSKESGIIIFRDEDNDRFIMLGRDAKDIIIEK